MRTPARSPALIIGGVAGVCALLGVVIGLALTSGSSDRRAAAPAGEIPPDASSTTLAAAEPSPTDAPTTTLQPTTSTAVPAAATTVTTRPPPAPLVPPPPPVAAPEGLGDPAVVARRFAAEYWTWRWDEGDGAPFARARPYISNKLAAEWAQSSSAAAAIAARRARHEVQTPAFDEIYEDPEQKGLWLVKGSTTTTADGLPPKRRTVDATLIILNQGGWRVDSVEDLG